MEKKDVIKEIKRLKEEKNAIILAHNYQIGDIQDIADYVGDSLQLARQAAEVEEDIIVFCGVHFMAESAKILSPQKKVLLPVKEAGCPMADMVTGPGLKAYKDENPNVPIVTYVNSSAEVKAYSDICCTSSNAVKVVSSLNTDRIMFAPDRNLATYVEEKLGDVTVEKWRGFCPTHERVVLEDLEEARKHYPGVKVLVHPETNPAVFHQADFVGSTSQIINYVKESSDNRFIIGTEEGILHTLKKQNPEKSFILLTPKLLCKNMKKTSLIDVYHALRDNQHEIQLDEEIRLKAHKALSKMLAIS